MSTTKAIRTVRDTFAVQARPDAAPFDEAHLNVRSTATSVGRQTFLAFGQVPIGARIVAATLHVFLRDATTGSRTLTTTRVTAEWSARSLTWNNRPTTTATNQSTAVVGAVAQGYDVAFNVAAMLQDVANGQAFYGVRIESSADDLVTLFSADAGKEERHPYLDLVYSVPPSAPTDLSPTDGQIVAVAKPVVAWTFGSPSQPQATQTYAQVQVASDSAFATGLFDSTKILLTSQMLDLATTAYAGAPADTTRYWRVRAWNDDDVQSEWSDVASFQFHAVGTVTFANPPVGGVVNDVTPPIDWTVAGMTQEAFRVFLFEQSAGLPGQLPWVERADSGRIISTATVWTIPDSAHLDVGRTYRVVVRVWDALVREPGTSSYVEATRDMTYATSAGTSAPAGLTATVAGAKVTLQWTRGSQPDFWSVVVDGTIREPRIPGASLFVSGTTYRYTYWGAVPRVSHTYEVAAVVLTTGVNKHSTGNPTAVALTSPVGIVLADAATNEAVWIAGTDEWAADVGESSSVYSPVGRRSNVLITDVVRGYEGSVSGMIVTAPASHPGVTTPGVTAKVARDVFLELRHPGRSLRLIIGDRNLPVQTYGMTALPIPNVGDEEFAAEFSFFQTDEFDVDWEG